MIDVPQPEPVVRFSRVVRRPWAVALGLSATVGLGVFVLVGWFVQQAGLQASLAYVLATVIFAPVALTYAERAAVTPGSGGAFSLARATDSARRAFASGWLTLGGYGCLVALLGWGAALHVSLSLRRLLLISVDLPWLAAAIVVVVALNDLIGTHGGWRLRTLIIYSGLLVLLIVVGWSWLAPTSVETPTFALPPRITLANQVAFLAVLVWGVSFVLNHRDEMRRPAHSMLAASLWPLGVGGVVGALAAAVVLRDPGLAQGNLVPVAGLAMRLGLSTQALLEAAYVLMSLLVILIALDRALVSSLRLISAMAQDGFLPHRLQATYLSLDTPLWALVIFAGVSALAAAFVPTLLLVGLAALAILWATALVNGPEILHSQPRLPQNRALKLPFHPLFPGLATAVGIFLPLALPFRVLLLGGGWLLLGGIFYLGYARQSSMVARKRELVVREAEFERPEIGYTVLVGVADPTTGPSLIRAGAALARAQGGRLLVLHVVPLPEQVPPYVKRQTAQEKWQALNAMAQQVGVADVTLDVLVRLAHTPVIGILDTIQEEAVDLTLLGWGVGRRPGEDDMDPVLEPIVRAAPCDVAILRGQLPQQVGRVLVPTAGGPHAPAALNLGRALVEAEGGRVVALNLVRGALTPASEAQARAHLQNTLAGLADTTGIEQRVAQADDVKTGILREAAHSDLLLVGAANDGILAQTIFGGLPVEVARSCPQPTILVKHFEGARRFRLRRLWETLTAPFPTLTTSERAEVYQQMRHAARPTIDFFVLITLAATIAGLGLLQDSAAVIIGAMLVAPLMSPILSMAMSIVQGNVRLLRLAAGSTAKGIVLAITVAVAITLISPASTATDEILARTQPTLLDLVVALASGAAAGYAVSRKEVSAALPGVAIAAALVPPLCVVGYGTATSQLPIAGGALLLFTTNLIAIVLAAATVFLLLGFHPTHAERQAYLRRGFLVSIISLIVISVPLALLLNTSLRQSAQQRRVETVLNEAIRDQSARVAAVTIERQDRVFVVEATIYTSGELDPDVIAEIQRRLIAEVEAPVTLRATVLQATVTEAGANLVPTPEP